MVGRFAETAVWILVVLGRRPSTSGALVASVRGLDGPVGLGTVVGALARLEHAGLVVRDGGDRGRERLPIYRLTEYPADAK